MDITILFVFVNDRSVDLLIWILMFCVVDFVGLSHFVLCPCCVCLWSLPPRALEHRWYPHNHCMLWKHDLASLMSSLSASMWGLLITFALLLSFRWNVVVCFGAAKEALTSLPVCRSWRCLCWPLDQSGCWFWPKVSYWSYILIHCSPQMCSCWIVSYRQLFSVLLLLQHPYHCVCRNCDSVYLLLRSSDAGKT